MNICSPGNCICDAREWKGDTNCMGEIDCSTCGREHRPGACAIPPRAPISLTVATEGDGGDGRG